MDVDGVTNQKTRDKIMNYIKAYKDSITEVESKNGSKLEFALRDAVILAKNIQGSVELKHEVGDYLIDKWGQVEVLNGEEPNKSLLPIVLRTE